jgi:hypothetical protein
VTHFEEPINIELKTPARNEIETDLVGTQMRQSKTNIDYESKPIEIVPKLDMTGMNLKKASPKELPTLSPILRKDPEQIPER